MVLRRPRISTTCQVHERRRVLVRFYRSNQPWGKGGLGVPHVSQTRLIPITKHQTHCSSLLHSLPIFKTHRYRIFFFPFWGYLETNLFLPTVTQHNWRCGLSVLPFPFFSFVLQTCV